MYDVVLVVESAEIILKREPERRSDIFDRKQFENKLVRDGIFGV